MIVVDASVVIEALVSGSAVGEAARGRLRDAPQLLAPHLLDVEVTSGLRRLEAGSVIPELLATAAIAQLRALPVDRLPHTQFLGRIWELRSAVSAYDATYVALAEAAAVPLITTDARLASAPGLECEVDVVT